MSAREIDYIGVMKMRTLILAIALGLATPLAAQDSEVPDEEDGLSLMERGTRLLMEGLLREMEPALEGLGELGPMFRDFAQEMGPALGKIIEQVEDWSVYHPPEMLPNGDIIIRRKTPEDTPEEPQENEQIDI